MLLEHSFIELLPSIILCLGIIGALGWWTWYVTRDDQNSNN